MRRAVVLMTLLGVAALSIAISAYQQPPAGGRGGSGALIVDKIKDNLYVIRGGTGVNGNTTVFIGTNGVVAVDTKSAGWGQPTLAKIQELTPKPVTTIINTHSHGDHTGGNVEFPGSVEFVAHENTKKNIEAWPPVAGFNTTFPNVIKDNGGKGLPTKTFKDKMTLGRGPDRIDLFYFGRAHTNGDTWVLFPALRVLVSGDPFANKGIGLVDTNAGGSGIEFPETLMKAYNGIKDVDVIITGHLPTTVTRDDLKTYAEFMRDFVAAAREAKKQGKTADEFAATWKTPEKYTGYPPAQAALAKYAAQAVMDESK